MAIMRPAMCQIDGTSERGLLGRFHVEGFPTIFHVQGTETRPYTGKRTMQKVMLSKDRTCTFMNLKGMLCSTTTLFCVQHAATNNNT